IRVRVPGPVATPPWRAPLPTPDPGPPGAADPVPDVRIRPVPRADTGGLRRPHGVRAARPRRRERADAPRARPRSETGSAWRCREPVAAARPGTAAGPRRVTANAGKARLYRGTMEGPTQVRGEGA